MQAVRRAIIAHIGNNASGTQPVVEGLDICTLMDETAFERGGEEGRTRCRHGCVN